MEARLEGNTSGNESGGKQRRRWDVPPGGIITDGGGRLRRNRPDTYHHPWSAVPVGPVVSAQKLSKGLNERDHLILLMAERAHVITTEQVARVFFDSPVTARKRIRLLRERRFLATPEVDYRVVSAAVGHRDGMHNAPLVLDWNGKYLLEHLGYQVDNWNAATVAQANIRFGHTLAVSEVWSYVAATARASHTTPAEAGDAGGGRGGGAHDRLAVGLLNERDSVVHNEGCTGWSLRLEKAGAQGQSLGTGTESRTRRAKQETWNPRPLVKPDATLVLSVTSDAVSGTLPASYQGNWRKAVLPEIPSPAAMRATEQLGRTKFRYMFLEMETGSNSSRDMAHKIERYNRLYNLLIGGDMMHGQSWRALFGPTPPVILVAVRDHTQVEMQVTLWLTHFEHKSPGTVILANLEVLEQAYAKGRSHFLTQPCWLDMMRPEGAKWKPLGEILGLGLRDLRD
jgi:hypothetical protein